ncbi:MAG: protein-disulfide reductase DsbD, partial [Burkholderiales bacterium]|nr:protein-disulfide reductase DsbD [Burkholderiales bacterium]
MNALTWFLPRRGVAVLFSIVLIVCSCWGAVAHAQQFLPAEQAFSADVAGSGPQQLDVRLSVAPGTYLYRERLAAQLTPGPGGSPIALSWSVPPGQIKHDPNFDKDVEVYHHDVAATLTVPAGLSGVQHLKVTYQGCADAGICYPPQNKWFDVQMSAQGQVVDVAPAATGGAGATALALHAQATANDGKTSADQDQIARALASGRLALIVPVFLLAGVLLSLTPCVLPMVPILSSIIVGHGTQVSRGRGFLLALSYSQGMALVYTGLGVAAGLLGQGLAAYLQHPTVVLVFAALMVLLSLSMFGLYELQLPASVQSWLGAGTSHLPGGRFVSVLAMGAVSALVVSPCVSAPLAGALLYISQTHDVVLGGSALYAMAWGMSMPLLLVGLSAGSLLPRTGPWMKAVKALFGLIMLLMAVWVSRPAWPYLQALIKGPDAVVSTHHSVLPFQRVRSVQELDAAVQQASRRGQAVMLDFYADWCTSCLEMEHQTFSDP